jgi:hypothetical protein
MTRLDLDAIASAIVSIAKEFNPQSNVAKKEIKSMLSFSTCLAINELFTARNYS